MNQRVKSSNQKTCKIKQGTPLTERLKKTYLIMWDEALIANRNCIEALDKSLKDILIFNNENIDKKNTRRDDRCTRIYSYFAEWRLNMGDGITTHHMKETSGFKSQVTRC